MLMLTESLHHIFVWPSENRRSRESDLKKQKQNKTRKAHRGLDPAVVVPPLQVQNRLRSLKVRAQVV